ncbi:MAG: NTP transferase domain-containing protein [Armatimonadota bacterium]
MRKLPAAVLAGAPATPEIAQKYGITAWAAVPIAGKPMLQHVVDALDDAGSVGEVHVVGNFPGAIPPRGSLVENLVAGVEACGTDGLVLVATSDIPFLTPEAVDDFLARCEEDADFYYAIVPKEACLARFPKMRRTYVRLAEGTFTGGNLFALRAGFVRENAGLIREVFAARKKPLKLAKIIGLSVLARAVLAQTIWPGALNIRALEATVGRILHAKLTAVPTPYAEIGADVDDEAGIHIAETILPCFGSNLPKR